MQKALDAFVRVAEAFLEAHHDLAVGADAEMPRLDDAGMNRSDRQLVDVLSFDRQEAVFLGWPGVLPPRGERSMHPPFAVIEPGAPIRQPGRRQCEQIGGGPLQPDRRRMDPPHRRVAAVRTV